MGILFLIFLKYIPMAALYGVFMFMGISLLDGLQARMMRKNIFLSQFGRKFYFIQVF